MDLIRRQVAQAHRRLVLQQFLAILPWCLFVTLLIAAIGIAIPKLWVLPIKQQVWMWSWLGGALGIGILTAIIWTAVVRRGMLDAAVEVDRRFGLKERVSSALMLAPNERDSDIGQALINDAVRRVEMIVVSERFNVNAGWRPLLPVLPMLAAFALAFLVPNAESASVQAATIAAQQKQQIKKSAEQLKEKLNK